MLFLGLVLLGLASFWAGVALKRRRMRQNRYSAKTDTAWRVLNGLALLFLALAAISLMQYLP